MNITEIELVGWHEERPSRFRFSLRIAALGLVIHEFYWARTAAGVFRVCGPVVRLHLSGKNVRTWRQLLNFEDPNGGALLSAITRACEDKTGERPSSGWDGRK
jgi:hypothetical protein